MEVGNAAYECNWYNLPPAKTKFLILIMIRAKQPFILTAGKFTAFSLQLFCSVCKLIKNKINKFLINKYKFSKQLLLKERWSHYIFLC